MPVLLYKNMDTETQVTDPIETQTNVDTVETTPETTDTTKQEEQPKPERPWNKKEPDPIPYHRFQEVNSKFRDTEAKYKEMEAKYAALEAKVNGPKMPEITNIDDIKPEQFKDAEGNIDNYAWLKARESYLQKETFKAFEQRQAQAEYQRRAAQVESDLAAKFDERLAESMKVDPEVKEATDWFTAQYANKLSPQVRYAIVTDENGPDLIKHLCTDGTDIMDMLSKNDEIGAIRAMAKWSAKFTRAEAKAEETVETEQESRPVFTPSKKPATPTVQGSKTVSKKIEDMSPAEYRKWRLGK